MYLFVKELVREFLYKSGCVGSGCFIFSKECYH